MSRLLVVGVSARALAESAWRAGYEVTAVDAFGDLDLAGVARTIVVRGASGRLFDANRAAAAAARHPAQFIAYTSNLENHPRAVARLAAGHLLLGTPPAALAAVRDPFRLARAFRRHRLPAPQVRREPPNGTADGVSEWLVKPKRSGGGRGIRRWARGSPVGRGEYLQEWIDGSPGSVVFVGCSGHARVLAITRQLPNHSVSGAAEFHYLGSLVGPGPDGGEPRLFRRAICLARTVAAEFGIVGLATVDFVARDGIPYPTEVNPRYSASMELIEWATGASLFALHAGAAAGRLGRTPLRWPAGRVFGKMIVYAGAAGVLGDHTRWIRSRWHADVPATGTPIAAGQPICTVFAEAESARRCTSALGARADAVRRALVATTRSAA